MKILTWNINGIRSSKIQLKQLLDDLDADIICLQETKVTRDQLDEPTAIVDGYNSYFSFSKARSGYSGVAIFCKDAFTPIKAEEGLSDLLRGCDGTSTVGNYGNHAEFSDDELQALDNEGRTVITQHRFRAADSETDELLTIINVYCPRADPDRPERKLYKIQFYKLLQARAEALLNSGSHVIVLGDVNTSHRRIDHCDPDDDKEFRKNPGRQWLDMFLWEPSNPQGPGLFVDSFRFFHPDKTQAFTCWNTSSGARATNYGTRIDYIFANVDLVKKSYLTDCTLHPDVEGSDHCPVKADVNINVLPALRCPSLCTKHMPEFVGKQQKLFGYFSAKVNSDKNTQRAQQLEKKTNSEAQVKQGSTTMKRSQSALNHPVSKKAKNDSKNNSKSKQCSLVSFFSKPKQYELCKSKSDSSLDTTKSQVSSEIGQHPPKSSLQDDHKQLDDLNSSLCCSEGTKTDTVPKLTQSDSKGQSELWKNVFKGPPPAPLCKGHSEPCVLRTVKKDSLNKGRQFWVCNRPEGHKTNPDARCDHFVWITKSKSKQ